jgi:hypothetical protein
MHPRAAPVGWLSMVLGALLGCSHGPGEGGTTVAPLILSPPGATVSPGAGQAFTVSGGVGPFRWALSSAPSGGSLALPSEYRHLVPAPAAGGVPQWQQWAHGQPVVVQDNQGTHQQFTLGARGAPGGRLQLLVSSGPSSPWTWVAPAGYAKGVDSDLNAGVMSLAQDSAGTVHLLFFRAGWLQVAYYRLTLTYAAGAITGYTDLVGPIDLPGAYQGDQRALLRVVTTASGAEVLAMLVTASDATGTRLQGSMCVTAALAPSSSADFLDLAGNRGAATRIVDDARGAGASHDHHLLFAQLGASRDLWVFGGNLPAESAPTPPTAITRTRLSASGSSWTPGPSLDGSTALAWLLAVAGTAQHAWAMLGQYRDGQVRFARVDASGGYEEPVSAIPSPVVDGRTDQTLFGVFTVAPDDTRLWAVFARDPGPGGHWWDFTPTGAAWDGTRWELWTDTAQGGSGAVAYAEGMGGSVGWDTGVVALMTRTDGTAFNGAIRLGSVGLVPGSAHVDYTAGPRSHTIDQVTVTDATGASASADVVVP